METSQGEEVTPEQLNDKIAELDRIETEVQDVSIPPGYAEDLYHLRLHIGYVRDRLHG